MKTYNTLELEIVRWAEARKIVQNSNNAAQARKTLEEAGELLEAAASMAAAKQAGDDLGFLVWREKYADAVGDVLVTLIVGCATADMGVVECLDKAYEEIKHRKGHLRADGVFVKEQQAT